jgi:hypothetical protein
MPTTVTPSSDVGARSDPLPGEGVACTGLGLSGSVRTPTVPTGSTADGRSCGRYPSLCGVATSAQSGQPRFETGEIFTRSRPCSLGDGRSDSQPPATPVLYHGCTSDHWGPVRNQWGSMGVGVKGDRFESTPATPRTGHHAHPFLNRASGVRITPGAPSFTPRTARSGPRATGARRSIPRLYHQLFRSGPESSGIGAGASAVRRGLRTVAVMSDDNVRWLTVDEACEALKVSPRTWEEWRARGCP